MEDTNLRMPDGVNRNLTSKHGAIKYSEDLQLKMKTPKSDTKATRQATV